MSRHILRLLAASAAFLSFAAPRLHAQDARGAVPEPTFPAVCTQVQADLSISNGEPSSETNTAHDTSMIQTALANCAQGQAVELVANGNNNAFVISPIYIPPGVTLLVDGGVTVFGSRVATDYQNTTTAVCGSTDKGTGCYALITMGQRSVGGSSTYGPSTPITGIMGYGVINGRGADKLITLNPNSANGYDVGASSWYDLAVGSNEDNPVLIQTSKTSNLVFYKITLLNSPHFHVRIQGQGSTDPAKVTNATVWGLKLLAPWPSHNTDGVDPTGTSNVSILNSIIGDGDDEIAISGSSNAQNFTFSNLLLTGGHGISVGSITTNGVSNVAVNNVNVSGQAADGNQIAIRIKSYCGSGGPVNNVTYNGVCVRNTATAIDLDPFYSSTTSTTGCPSFGATAPINYQNIYISPFTNGSGATVNPKINFQGFNTSTLSYFTLNNVFVNSSTLNLVKVQSADTVASPAYDSLTLNGSYYPSAWGTLNNTTNSVTEVNNGTLAPSFPASYCTNSYPTLEGELYANVTVSGSTTNNVNQTATVTLPATVTLNAMVQPTNSTTSFGAYTGAAAPTANVQFLDGTTVVGTGTLGSNGTLASVTLTNPTAGTHVYTAKYVGDSNYPAMPFGTTTYTGTQNGSVPAPTPLTLTVVAGPASQLAFSTPPAASLVYGNGPGTVSVVAKDVAGDVLTSLSGVVTLTVSGPNGYSATYTATANGGTATFSNIATPAAVGAYTYAASQAALTPATASEIVTPGTLVVTANQTTRVFDAPDPDFTYQIAGFANGDTASVVSGTPVLGSAAVRTSPAGSYPINISQGTLSASNYNFQLVGGTLTVTGGAPQNILFLPLPNFASGASYQLAARTTSGLPVSYTVSGAASVSGTTLTVTGTGPVTVTANSGGNTNYAAATSVSQGFTAR